MPLDEIRDSSGMIWKLGWRAPDQDQLKLRASGVALQEWREKAGLPGLIPRPEWKSCDYLTGYPLTLIEDQGQIGSCSAFTATGAGNRQRFMRGMAWEKLSGFWLYDQVNSGHDRGSNIGEVNEVVRRLGIPPLDSYPKCTWHEGQNPSGVQYYREEPEITLSSFDEIVTALLMGILPQFPVDAGNMQRFTDEGVGFGHGSNSNHSVYGAGVGWINAQWCVRGVTSWRAEWGPFENGSWWMTERQIADCAVSEDGNGHIVPLSPTNSNTGSDPEPV